ncbi:MAG TPA: 3-ketoacyl-ACP reductase [Phototrophicaceae bacterium]|nr:3-ketoacyl-ACP reductase [Phototrophicaceae bacterium]
MIDQRVALITGAGRGIGRGIALALSGCGWFTIVNYRANQEAAQETVQTIQQTGGAAAALRADISQEAERRTLVQHIVEQYGRIDLFVNNAGMAPRQRLELLQTTEASYDEVMATNLKGPFFLTQLVARQLIAQRDNAAYTGKPLIINIGSISAYTSSPNRSEYCLSKAGFAMMTALFADALSPYGIPVYEVRPGIIETDMTSGVTAKYDELINQGLTPIRRWGQPEDIGKAVVALAEGYFPFSTGEVFNVDGGFHLRRF